MEFVTKIIKDIETAALEIISGNVISLPTETVYGLAADALNVDAVMKIFEIKNRPSFNPLIVHIESINSISKYGEQIPEELYKIAEKYSPGPITYVVKKKRLIPDIVTAGLESVALRIPAHALFREVIRITKKPIAAPSANMFGRISPTNALDVLKELKGKINYILDGGECTIGIESTVISFIDERITILRPGFVTKEELEDISGMQINTVYSNQKNAGNNPIEEPTGLLSPGMLNSHYAPKTPLYITDDLEHFQEYNSPEAGVINLEKIGSLHNIAINLFRLLREYDEKNYKYLVTSKVINSGIGIAVNDRLVKASTGLVRIIKNDIKFIGK